MTKGITFIRNGYGNWYIRHTCFNDTPERTAAWIKSLKCDSNGEDD